MSFAQITARRENGHRRPKGYADWRPQAKTCALLEQVNAVLDEYYDFLPLTVRQIFYRLVGAYEYDKTESAYARLGDHLVRARRARLIPFEAIRDDGVVIYTPEWYSDLESFHNETAERARGYRRSRQAGQDHRIELWTEAAGMAPQLTRVAYEYSVPVYSSGGFSSLTAVRQIVDRSRSHAGATVLLHVGDYDPSGEAIFTAIATDAAAFLEEDRIINTQQIVSERVALTAEQVAGYDLPTTPAKSSDTRSRNWQGTETCQLEALAPDELAAIVRSAIDSYFDVEILQLQLDREHEERAELLGLPRGTV